MNKFESEENITTDEQPEQPIKEEVWKLELEIRELREAIRHLLEQLHGHIDAGEYKLLIGGDASGRIPALIFDKIIKKIYREKGFDIPRTMSLFIAGGTSWISPLDEKSKRISDHISKHYIGENLNLKSPDYTVYTVMDKLKMMLGKEDKIKYDGRVLIIEDTIASGASIKPVTDALKKMGIDFDIATIGLQATDEKRYIEKILGGKIFYSLEYTPGIYRSKSLSGVKKDRGDLFSQPNISDASRKAKLDVNKVANELAEWYLSNF